MALNPIIPQKSLPLGVYPMTLHTLTAIKTYNRTCERVDRSLYLAQIAVRVRGTISRRFETEIAQVETLMLGHLDKLEHQLAEQRKHLQKLLRKSGVAANPDAVPYSQPAEITIKVKTPKAGHYAKLLETLDTLTRLVDLAWYNGVIDANQQLQLSLTMHRWFVTHANSIANLARGLARRVSEDSEGVETNYAAMLKKRIGVAPTDGAPLDVDSLTMTAAEQAELADTIALSAALEQAGSESDTETLAEAATDAESRGPESAAASDETPAARTVRRGRPRTAAADSAQAPSDVAASEDQQAAADTRAAEADSAPEAATEPDSDTGQSRSPLARVFGGGQS